MNKIILRMLTLLWVFSFGITIYGDETNYRNWQLPGPGEYDGGYYPRWAPVEFTYKQYKGAVPLVSLEYITSVMKEFPGRCRMFPESPVKYTDPEVLHLIAADRLDEIDHAGVLDRLERDPEYMYAAASFIPFYGSGDNEALRRRYLLKAASQGHVTARVTYLRSLENDPQARQKLGLFAEITPYAVWDALWDYIWKGDVGKVVWILENSGEMPYLTRKLLYILEIAEWEGKADFAAQVKQRVPHYDDYRCETLYRGCWHELYFKDLVCDYPVK